MTSTPSTSTKVDENSKESCKLDDFIKNGFKTFVEATKSANELPKNRDFDFCNTQSSFSTPLNTESDRLLQLINKILNVNDISGNIKSASLASKEELIGEANDVILDRAVAAIDEMNGLRSLPAAPVIQTVSADVTINGSWNKVNKFTVNDVNKQLPKLNAKSVHLLTAKNIVRPQTYFKDKVENSNTNPWKPRIMEKPNSLKPLALYLEESEVNEGFEEWSHPYEFELEHFKVPEEFLMNIKEPQKVKHLNETPLYEISTEEELDNLVDELRKHKEIAVDLEHHSYRTFQGITCLMQISTREADYLIDTLSLRHKLYVLNEVFTKPSILKIFHGAGSDIQWLQRDLSLYVVNMFDTHQAAKTLGFSGLSLAYLLHRYCSFMPNKKFQLADWRIRPLPQELKDYAREDTHYLIYIYEMMKKELYKQANGDDNLVKAVFQASTQICQTKYIKPRWTPDAHLNLCRRRKKMFDNRQMYALKEIYKWRDTIAREEDESIGYVLPNHMMLQIAEMLPREVQGILASCSPIPPLVRAHSLDLHHAILRAREQPLEKIIMQETNRRTVGKEEVRINIDSPLHCPHDLTKQTHQDNLPTLLNCNTSKDVNENILSLEKPTSSCKIFNEPPSKPFANRKLAGLKFLGPFERYKLIRPFLQAEADKAKAEQEKVNEKTQQTSEENDPSVQDRIAALHEHFIQVKDTMKQTEAQVQQQPRVNSSAPLEAVISLDTSQPLINMPGSKKRKRDQSTDRFAGEASMQKSPKKRNVGGKKDGGNNGSPKQKKGKNNNKNKNKKNQYQNNKSLAVNHHNQGNQQQASFAGPQPGGRFLPERTPESFVYSQVDYSQFGGGGKAVGFKQFESKHRGKGQNKRGGGFVGRGGRGGRGNTQSMTFQPQRGRGFSRGRK